MPNVILERNDVALTCSQLASGPLVEDDFELGDRGKGGRGKRGTGRWGDGGRGSIRAVPSSPRLALPPSQFSKAFIIEPGNQRVGNRAFPRIDAVGKIRKHWQRAEAYPICRLTGELGQRIADHLTVVFE